MKEETNRYSIRIYTNYSLSVGGAFKNLNSIMAFRPQQFCINDVNDLNYPQFKEFTKKYLAL